MRSVVAGGDRALFAREDAIHEDLTYRLGRAVVAQMQSKDL